LVAGTAATIIAQWRVRREAGSQDTNAPHGSLTALRARV